MIIFLCALAAWVGYMFGVWKQMKRGDKELEAAHAKAKFWLEIAEKQAAALKVKVPEPPPFHLSEMKKP